ncbi:MAG: HAMP domain-containing sensor histidine kinase [Planctomycetota bacterium]|nr:HAMP domain-containing sensor histidine kinase [Planctomycetota bacterium]
MPRARWSIIVFVAGVCGVLGALAWMTTHALRLERLELEARRQARYQESLRLALWRMDAKVTPLIAREAARPFFHYQPFYEPEHAYSRLAGRADAGAVLVPSPLLQGAEGFVRLHYERGPDGALVSPQAPAPRDLDVALGAQLTGYVAAASEADFKRLSGFMGDTRKNVALGEADAAPADDLPVASQDAQRVQSASGPQLDQSYSEYTQRQSTVTSANVPGQRRDRAAETDKAPPGPSTGREMNKAASERAKDETGASGLSAPNAAEPPAPEGIDGERDEVWTGPFAPRWVVDENGVPQLLFEREVRLGEQRVVQGFWLDWGALRDDLLAGARDLFPKAELRPLLGGVEGVDAGVLARTLAAIPAELAAPALPEVRMPLVTPVRTTLMLTWALALAAVVVLALVMRASVELAERRGQFVSAVTHELRTPLTTFVMYSQMLADGLVSDEDARRSYIGTLRTESQRLARIVESVLDYARLSKRRRPSTVRARLTAEQIVDGLAPVLRARCEQSGMELVVDRESLLDFPVTTDPPTLERILYNLVDNACKYAASGDDRRVHLVARMERRDLVLAVRDHGPGIAAPERTQVFRAFTRGSRQQDGSIPGLGLGLALAQGLARELGGDLRLASSGAAAGAGAGHGAEFEVRLPRD